MADNGNKFVTFLKNNWIKYLVQTVIALILSLIVMNFRGAFNSELASADRFKGVCDGFSVTAMLYISFGILMWGIVDGLFLIYSAMRSAREHTRLYREWAWTGAARATMITSRIRWTDVIPSRCIRH